MKEWPVPTTVKDIRQFLGFCNFYRRFVHHFAKVAGPLNNLTKQNAWQGSLSHEALLALLAFQELKSRLCSAPVLKAPDFSKPFYIHVDA